MECVVIKCFIRTLVEYCLHTVIEVIPMSFLYAMAVGEEIGRQNVGPENYLRMWAQVWAWMGWRGRYICRQERNKLSHKFQRRSTVSFRTTSSQSLRFGCRYSSSSCRFSSPILGSYRLRFAFVSHPHSQNRKKSRIHVSDLH